MQVLACTSVADGGGAGAILPSFFFGRTAGDPKRAGLLADAGGSLGCGLPLNH
jgi:hypothetical protein